MARQTVSPKNDVQTGIWRGECDEACRALSVPEPIIMTIYLGVRIGGQGAWDRLTALKANGYTRMAPLTDLPPYASP